MGTRSVDVEASLEKDRNVALGFEKVEKLRRLECCQSKQESKPPNHSTLQWGQHETEMSS